MTQKEIAISIIENLSFGDVELVKKYVTEDYIQHNPMVPTGREAFIDFLNYLNGAPTKTSVKIIRVIEDNNFVALHSLYTFPGQKEQIAFDVFRFEDGKIKEHWDNLADVLPPNPSGRSSSDGDATIEDLDKTEENKVFIEDFINNFLINKKQEDFTIYFDKENYIQHNPMVGDGIEGFKEYIKANMEKGIIVKYQRLFKTIAEGNFVLTMCCALVNDTPYAFYDLFRLENGKIKEHWDVQAPIPPQEEFKNKNHKF